MSVNDRQEAGLEARHIEARRRIEAATPSGPDPVFAGEELIGVITRSSLPGCLATGSTAAV